MKILHRRTVWPFMVLFVVLLSALILYSANTGRFASQPAISTPPTDAIYLDQTQPIDVRVADLLSYMTLEEKIG